MYISSKPSVSLKYLFQRECDGLYQIFPFNTPRCTFFYSGRYAFAAGLKALGIKPEEEILMPSYNCWVEIDPVKRHNIKAKYYGIRRNFTADLKDIEGKIDDRTKALLITHYLGFPQPLNDIMAICKRHKIFLIEDCAHAFLSDYEGRPLGSFGDISIFSFRKTLPIPNGAALVVNAPDIKIGHPPKLPNSLADYYLLAEGLKYRTTNGSVLSAIGRTVFSEAVYLPLYAMRYVLRAIHKATKKAGATLVYPNGNTYHNEAEKWGMSQISRKVIENMDFAEIKKKRRDNFVFLLNYFRDDKRVSLPLKELPEGVCPLFFPIVIEKRDLLYRRLKERGIAGHDWWGHFHPDVPWKDFAEEEYMKKNIFGFPVHQDLTRLHLQKVVDQFEKSYSEMLRTNV